MKRYLSIVCLNIVLIPLIGKSQDQTDALRYSQNMLGGTARFTAMGGAFCSLGADMTSLAYNPAGIAVFNKNQFTITPGLTIQNTSSTYNNTSFANNSTTMTNQSTTFDMQNIGLVGTWKSRKKDNPWKSFSFGITYNRMNNFNDNITIQGLSSRSSMLDAFQSLANGTNYSQLDPYYAGPAFNAYLLDTLPNTGASQYGNLVHPYLSSGNNNEIEQTENLISSGSMGETDISFGGNYNDRLFIGATIGIVDVNYNENITYSEAPYNYTDTVQGLQSFTYQSNLSTTGGGANFKVGFIYRIMDWLRVGAAIHTPTVLSLQDVFNTAITANYNPTLYNGNEGFTNAPPQSPDLITNYTLTTPFKAIGGASVIINNQGILSADYEYVDYSTANLNASGNVLPPGVNQAISQDYMMASNLRFGFEWVLYLVSFRAGYAIYGNPYSSAAGNSSLRSTYSAGIGLKINNAFIDVAYSLLSYTENYYLYTLSNTSLVSPVVNKTYVSNILMTVGVNFDHQNNHGHRRDRFRSYPPPPPPPPPNSY